MGKPITKIFYYYKLWTEPKPCMVLGLKPMGKPSTKILIITSSGQNQGLVWSSDPSLWGNQLQNFFYYYKFWTEPRPCMVLGLKPMGKPSTKILIITSFGQNQGLVWSSDPSLWENQLQNFFIIISFGRNQGVVLSSDLSLRGNQLLG